MTELVDASEMMTKYHKYVVFKLMFIVACIIAMVISTVSSWSSPRKYIAISMADIW